MEFLRDCHQYPPTKKEKEPDDKNAAEQLRPVRQQPPNNRGEAAARRGCGQFFEAPRAKHPVVVLGDALAAIEARTRRTACDGLPFGVVQTSFLAERLHCRISLARAPAA